MPARNTRRPSFLTSDLNAKQETVGLEVSRIFERLVNLVAVQKVSAGERPDAGQEHTEAVVFDIRSECEAGNRRPRGLADLRAFGKPRGCAKSVCRRASRCRPGTHGGRRF